jgi:hypothetical protein
VSEGAANAAAKISSRPALKSSGERGIAGDPLKVVSLVNTKREPWIAIPN